MRMKTNERWHCTNPGCGCEVLVESGGSLAGAAGTVKSDGNGLALSGSSEQGSGGVASSGTVEAAGSGGNARNAGDVDSNAHGGERNPTCACGGAMKKIYVPPQMTYLEFLRAEDLRATASRLREG